MRNEKHIFDFLKKDKTQRLIYLGISFLWLFIGLDFIKYKYEFSPFRLNMLVIMIVPTLLLIGPIFLNRIILWIGALGFSLIYSLWTAYKVIFYFSANLNRDYAPSAIWGLKDISKSILLILISFFISWIIWKIKPLKK